jgi:[ribosomal protein S18]-alanine N-acetyltransferase
VSVSGHVVCERAQPSDAQALAELDLLVSARPWSEVEFLAILAADYQDLLILVVYRREAERVARQLLAYCAFQLLPPELEIHGLAVRSEHRRQGWGRRLLRLALDEAQRRGAALAALEVRESNVAARALYGAEGFVELYRRPQYYREPAEDALILQRELRPQRTHQEP